MRPPGLNRGDQVTGSALAKAFDLANRPIRGGRGTAIVGDRVIAVTGIDSSRKIFWWGRIMGNTPLAGSPPYQWSYDVEELYKPTAGYGGWEIKPNGRAVTAYNFFEDPNDGAGIEGHGIDVDALPGTFTTQPIPTDITVPVVQVKLADGTKEFWFWAMNGIDGECP